MSDLLLRSLGPAAGFLVALVLARRASASVRHLLAVVGLAAILAVPLFVAILPTVRLSVLPAAPPPVVPVATTPINAPVVGMTPAATALPEAPAPKVFPWAALWAFGGLALAFRWILGLLWLHARLRRATRIDLDLPTPLGEGGRGEGFRKTDAIDRTLGIPVLECDAFRVPVTAWAGRPAVILPPDWRDWTAERLGLVLRHEAAHVRRGDGLSLLLSRLACAVLWPNPLVWILAHAESRLAERAVDDLVLSEGTSASQYGEALLDFAKEPRTNGALPALGMAAKAQLAHRVEMILNPKTPRTLVSRDARRAALSLALLAAVPVAVLGFDAQTPSTPPSPSKAPAQAPVPEPSKPRVLVECTFLKATEPLGEPLARTASEALLKNRPDVTVLARPRLFTLDGTEATIKTSRPIQKTTLTVNGQTSKVRDEKAAFDTEISVLPTLDAKGGGTLRLGASVGVDGVWRTSRTEVRRLGGGETCALRLPTVKGSRDCYVLLARMAEVVDERPVSSAQIRPSAPVAASTAEPVQVLLKCKVLRTDDPGEQAVAVSKDEPSFAHSGSSGVVSAPVVRTLSGMKATVRSSTSDEETEITLLPTLLKDGRYSLAFESSTRTSHVLTGHAQTRVILRANDWFRIRLASSSDHYGGYQMLVQLLPIKGD